MTHPLLVDLSDITMEYQGELSELQNDDSIKALFKIMTRLKPCSK